MRKAPRVDRKWVVRYEPLPEGIENDVQEGIQGEFESEEEARDAARKCDRWFNTPVVLEQVEHAETGKTVPVKRRIRRKWVRIWIEKYLDGEPEGEPCEAGFEEVGEKRTTKSSRAVAAAG